MSHTQPSILHVCASDIQGGAALAAIRLVRAQRKLGLDTRMLVIEKAGQDDFVEQLSSPLLHLRVRAARAIAKRYAARTASSHAQDMRSLGLVSTGIGREVERRSADLVHLHWLGAETASIQELAQISAPVVWSCQDEWAWCGAEHYAQDRRFSEGYAGKDVDARVFARKQRIWKNFSPSIIAPSQITADRCSESILFGDRPVTIVPNIVDFEDFHVADRAACRSKLGYSPDEKVILFGAQGGSADPRKGFDLLLQSLERLKQEYDGELKLVVFGGRAGDHGEIAGLPFRDLGHLSSAAELVEAYCAADLYVTPSRQETFGNTTLEALACGTPCVAYAAGGAPEMLGDGVMGDVIKPFDVAAFALAMKRWLQTPLDHDARTQRNALAHARFGEEKAARTSIALYADILQRDVL